MSDQPGLRELIVELRAKIPVDENDWSDIVYKECADLIESALDAQESEQARKKQELIEAQECITNLKIEKAVSWKDTDVERVKLAARLDAAEYMRSIAGDHVMESCDGTCPYCLYIAEIKSALSKLENKQAQDSKP